MTTPRLRAEVYFTSLRLDELQLKDRNVVILDVLRSGTSIAVALQSGAKQIIPVNNIESAMRIAGGLSSEVTLRAGERNAKMIEGFQFGNSPREFTPEAVRGKSIIFLTTNGTGAVVKGRHASTLVMGGFVNLTRITDFLAGLGADFVILCAGKENSFSLEDAVCAGRILNLLRKRLPAGAFELNDSAVAAMTLDKAHGKAILEMLKNSEHGRYLESIGLGEDLVICAAVDSVPVLPRLEGTVLKLQSAG
jgi:2-phosphosulfolactate phosphatase